MARSAQPCEDHPVLRGNRCNNHIVSGRELQISGPPDPAAVTSLAEGVRSNAHISTAKLNDVDPLAWLADVLTRIADIPQSRLPDLLRWNLSPLNLQAAA